MIGQVTRHTSISYKMLMGCIFILSLLYTLSCKSEKDEVQQVLETHIKKLSPDVTDVKLNLFHTNPAINKKAYASVTITHGFSSANGKPQPEYLGFILIKQDNSWKVDEGTNTGYTTDPNKANTYLAGGK